MNKRLLAIAAVLIYCAFLIKVMVFKDLPAIRVGHLMFRFGGTHSDQPPNFIPVATIASYIVGHKGLLIGGLNILGNIVLLVPLGFLLPFIFLKMTWKTALIPAIASGLTIEILQTILNVGVFDVDDIILNGLGAMVGYWIFSISETLYSRKSR